MHQQTECQQLPRPCLHLAALVPIAVGQAQQHRHQYIGQADPYSAAAQPEAITAGHQRRHRRHQRAAKQPGHAQHGRAGIEDQALLQDDRSEHADHAGGAEQQPGQQRRHDAMISPQAPIDGLQPAQGQQQSSALNEVKNHDGGFPMPDTAMPH